MIMKEKKTILVVGSANTDLVISAEHFPLPGETMFGHGFMTNHGGKGANQAVAAARLEGKTVFIGKLGNDQFGHSTVEMLKGEGIDVSALTLTDEAPSGVAVITTISSGENSIVLDSGANALLSPAALGKKYGAYVVLNPAPAPKEPLPEALLKNVDLLIPNETEAAYISGVEIKTEDDMTRAMDEIQKLGVKDVIITVGSKGVCARIDGQLIRVPAFKVKAVDTTAAGDTFCGALCVALSEGKALEDAIRFGNKASSISVTRRGAQMSMPHLSEIESNN